MGQAVFEAHPGPKTYVQFPGSGHSDVAASLVVPHITRFVDEVLEAEASVEHHAQLVESAGA
jgi:hypothetical protein